MRRGVRMGIVAVGVVALLALGAAFLWRGREETGPVLREVAVERGDLAVTILTTGVVQPRNRLEIKPPIAGRVEEVLVREGQTVGKGQMLAWMSSTERAALLDAARAKGSDEVRRWEQLYRATPILAPIRGTVISRNVEPGQTFTSQDAIFVMSDRLTVKAQVDETDIAQIRLKQSAVVELDAYPGQPVPGVVEQIAYDAKTVSNVTTYEVDVLPERIPPFMRSGMTANVQFEVARVEGALLLPSNAVLRQDEGATVLVPDGKRPPIEREIQAGLSDGRRVEVVAGLAEGDTVLAPELRAGVRSGGQGSPLTPFGRRR